MAWLTTKVVVLVVSFFGDGFVDGFPCFLKVGKPRFHRASVFGSNSWRGPTRTTTPTRKRDSLELVSTLAYDEDPRRRKTASTAIERGEDFLAESLRQILAELQRLSGYRGKKDIQTFLTGKDPSFVKLKDDIFRDELAVSGTTMISNANLGPLLGGSSATSFEHAKPKPATWKRDAEQLVLPETCEPHAHGDAEWSFALVGEICNIKRPGYLSVLPSSGAGRAAENSRPERRSQPWTRHKNYEPLTDVSKSEESDRLWVTGFSLTGSKGYVHSIDPKSGHVSTTSTECGKKMMWPNEASSVPSKLFNSTRTSTHDDALLVSDGFLVPGKDKGGVYVVQHPGHESESTVCLHGGLNAVDKGWFYHRSVWVDLTGDGRKSILTCRAQMNSVFGVDSKMGRGELIWLEQPKPHHVDDDGNPREADGAPFDPFAARYLPWKEHVLDEGPDVMFTVADLDTTDGCVEVIASNFFDKKVTLHSIQKGQTPRISFRRTIDESCGAALGAVLADLDCSNHLTHHHQGPQVVDSGSTVHTMKPGDAFSHVLVTSHECDFRGKAENEEQVAGGSLYAYKVPKGKEAWKTEAWTRTTVASGFKVKAQFANIINPGAPGFVYTFHPKKDETGGRPMIAVAGDCAEKAYLFRPVTITEDQGVADKNAQYKLMVEIDVGATVGSIGVGYNDFCGAVGEDAYAKLYIPAFEKDKIHVFALGAVEF